MYTQIWVISQSLPQPEMSGDYVDSYVQYSQHIYVIIYIYYSMYRFNDHLSFT